MPDNSNKSNDSVYTTDRFLNSVKYSNSVPFQFSNIMLTLSYFTPLLTTILIVFLGIASDKLINVSIFIFGLLCSQLLVNVLGVRGDVTKDDLFRQLNRQECHLFSSASSLFTTGDMKIPPSITTLFYTITYAMIAMGISENFNFPLIFFFISLTVNHIYHSVYTRHCFNKTGVFFSLLIGLGLSIGTVYGLVYTGNRKLLMFATTSPSTNTQCSKPSNKKFKCRLYKDGELVV